MTYHGARSDDTQALQGSLAHLRCCAELLLSAGGALQWCQPQSGGKVATPFEGCGEGANAARAVAVTGPTPGIVANRRAQRIDQQVPGGPLPADRS
jgi:hypothetical protein